MKSITVVRVSVTSCMYNVSPLLVLAVTSTLPAYLPMIMPFLGFFVDGAVGRAAGKWIYRLTRQVQQGIISPRLNLNISACRKNGLHKVNDGSCYVVLIAVHSSPSNRQAIQSAIVLKKAI